MNLRNCIILALLLVPAQLPAQPAPQPPNTWVKRSPQKDAPPSAQLSYEGSWAYDPVARRIIRWGGHAQGGVKGSGEQITEVWTLDPATMKFELKQPNNSPPAVCCAQQNVFDTAQNRFVRFPSFSGNHGWQWFREIYLNNTSVWNYDLATNTWRNRRPLPEPQIGPVHCASWDTDQEVVVIHRGAGSQDGTHIYDPYTNTWTKKEHKIKPKGGSGGNMAYDAARKLHILFGMLYQDDPHTWAYDVAKDQWIDMKPAVQPPTNDNDAVLAYDSANQVVVAVVRVKDHLETWAYDTGKNTWTHLKPAREPDGAAARTRLITYVPDQNLFVLESCINPVQRVPGVDREEQIWTYRFAEAKPAPTPQAKVRTQPRVVEDAVVSVISPKQVAVSWPASPGKDIVGYHVERAVVEVFSDDENVRLKKDTTPLPEPSVGGVKAIGAFQRLTSAPVKETRFTDTTVDLSKPQPVTGNPLYRRGSGAKQFDAEGKPYRLGVYAYRIRAVNAKGEESGPSAYYLTIPSAPQHLYSREEGEKCHLKWAANPEQGIKGYRVYWMKGPRPEGAGQKTVRLTPDPVASTQHTDNEAGKEVRRYWVVAVDALGQEGIPSSATWHYRTCRHIYVPFVGEWHQ